MISEGHREPSFDVQDIELSTVTGAHFSKPAPKVSCPSTLHSTLFECLDQTD